MRLEPLVSDDDRALHYLRLLLDDSSAEFRPGQWESIRELLANRRMLVVQRTGWGKSAVYFIATRMLRDREPGRVALAISPLLSLMRNQLKSGLRIDVKAATINSSNTDDWPAIQRRLEAGEIDLLFISPERLANDKFRDEVLIPMAGRVGLFVVDEAHCISDWGHDFRPDYRRIVSVLRLLPRNVPVVATTATANDRVVADVRHQMGDVEVQRGELVRRSLRLQNVTLPTQTARLAWLAQHIPALPGSGIVYTLTVRDAERVARWLTDNGIVARAYHSESLDREQLEDALLRNELKALVATVALGMGFDKPDLGFVVHFQRPGSVVHYYQQVGRAGRAVDEAYGILLSGDEDDDIVDYFIATAFPPDAHVELVLGALEQHDGLTIAGLEQVVNLSRGKIDKVLKMLSFETPAPVRKEGGRWYRTPADFKIDRERIDALCALRRAEQKQMQEYMRTNRCLMQFLSEALDDPHAAQCGRCANCVGRELVPSAFEPRLAQRASLFLRHSHIDIAPRKLWPGGGLPRYGFNGRISEGNETGRALSLYNDAGWGELVKRGKYETGVFGDDLVEGCAQMVAEWSPRPRPEWVTCVPSKRHPELVPSFAKHLAAKLKLPFHPAVVKAEEHQPQKLMENSVQQARNLDGVFEVDRRVLQRRPVLLVDDIVDSGWTLTVVGALLRQAGCPAVFPVALASAAHGGA
ncbi:MAG: RecQ family ATP-dependent DNA helicase [Thermoanaerobaculia bacterium]